MERTALLSAAAPLLQELESRLQANGLILALCDRNGSPILTTAGGRGHLLTATLGAVSAPVRDLATGEVLGSICLDGEPTAEADALVAAAASAAESRLALLEAECRQAVLEACVEQLAAGPRVCLGALDRHGQLLRAASTSLPPPGDPATPRQAMAQVQAAQTKRAFAWFGADGRHVDVILLPIFKDGLLAGALIEPTPLQAAPPKPAKTTPEIGQGLIGQNPSWLAALDRAARVARTDSTLLISGETGTGKEVLAQAVHRASSRASAPFLAINCGALPPTLIASELFGYVGGAYTGANPRGAPGKVEAANGGTLFLDEVSELPPEAQVSLLRVLQERELVRVGGRNPIAVNVRIIAATNRDLAALVVDGHFRRDLFYRLNVVPVHLPPLRERREDILPLVDFGYRRLGASPPNLSLGTCERLTAYSWPGNVRELLNLVEQAVALGEDPADLLPLPALSERRPPARSLGEAGEEERIREALRANQGVAAAACRALGMSRSTLYRKLEQYGIRLGRQIQS